MSLLDAGQRGLDTISYCPGKGVRPLVDSLRADPDMLCDSLRVAAEQSDGRFLVHDVLNHSSAMLRNYRFRAGDTLAVVSKNDLLRNVEDAERTYGKRLQEALTLAKRTRGQLAEALGISPQAIGKIIRPEGRTKTFTAYNNMKAAEFLRVDAYWLATGEGEARPKRTIYSPRALELAEAYEKIPGQHEKDIAWATTQFFATGQKTPRRAEDDERDGEPEAHGHEPTPKPRRGR
jgi:transcriptional regulator with XRE-family HTH domain